LSKFLDKCNYGWFVWLDSGKVIFKKGDTYEFIHTGIGFKTNHVVRIETNENKLVFANEWTREEYRMAIDLTEMQWNNAFFFVYPKCYGSVVSILPPLSQGVDYGCEIQ
jgi:hypothetical protein